MEKRFSIIEVIIEKNVENFWYSCQCDLSKKDKQKQIKRQAHIDELWTYLDTSNSAYLKRWTFPNIKKFR